MKINKSKGFTLIELLVVIAIIGILAAVLMVNLSSTRNRAKDSAIKLEMGQIRTAMESFYIANSTYEAGLASAEVDPLITSINTDNTGDAVEHDSAAGFCVSTQLATTGTYWCVDSTGYAGELNGCEGTNYTCKVE